MKLLRIEDGVDQIKTFSLSDLSFNWLSVSLLYLVFTILTPIKEEIIFRGILFSFLKDRYNFWIGFVVSSVIFGLLHNGHTISITIIGAIFLLLYKLTKSLVVPILLHIIWNAIAISNLLLAINSQS
ncbi:membrane protease YdiL (CAAX protease family) [Metabacillus crassostreae]|uniref:CPBP family intramembrane glutamic endopeptidase n=1 Tax=Metabacillus crassostreae TaxID=929098 RepID=UPI001956A8D1|nr:CPBP family intramembrane glutamic endopeptidase [Metabacillus crassostreae]MBM7604822.1 membrane protease YdiL (CAAX protease family) [Metabacillus crassostreae]